MSVAGFFYNLVCFRSLCVHPDEAYTRLDKIYKGFKNLFKKTFFVLTNGFAKKSLDFRL